MDFSTLEGFEELFSDGVLDPLIASPEYRENAKTYKQVANRVFLLYDPNANPGMTATQSSSATSSDRSERASGKADFDMVFIHGIGSDEFKCWTNEKGIIWPAVFIPQDFPSARVFTLGYAHALWNWKRPVSVKEEKPSVDPVERMETLATPEPPKGRAARRESVPSRPRTASGADDSSFNPLDAVWDRLPDIDMAWRPIRPGKEGRKRVDTETAHLHGAATSKGTPSSPSNTADAAHPTSAAASETNQISLEPPHSRSTLYKLLMEDSVARADIYSSAAQEWGAAVASETEKQDARQLQSYRVVAADIADRLLNAGVGTGERPVVIVAHSMGGLMTKQLVVSLFQLISLVPWRKFLNTSAAQPSEGRDILHDSYEAALARADVFLHSLRGVVFYGTPHFGSGLASVITGLQRYYANLGGLTPAHVVTGLGDHNKAALTLLNDQFMEVVTRLDKQSAIMMDAPDGASQPVTAALRLLSAPSQGLSIMSLGETKRLKNLIRIVEPESANPAPDNPRFPFYLIDGDHSQINRPASKTSTSYAMLYSFLDRLQQRGMLLPSVSECGATGADGTTAASVAVSPASLQERNREGLNAFEERAWDALRSRAFSPSHSWATAPRPQGPSACTEVFILLHALEEAQRTLRASLARFFGRVVPPQLDGLFLLGADVNEFFQQKRVALLNLMPRSGISPTDQTTAWNLHDTFVQSFVIPARLLMYWTVRATDMIANFEDTHREMVVTQVAMEAQCSFSDVIGDGGAGLTSHLSTCATRQIRVLDIEVSTLQGEWEGFRRCLSLTIRQETLRQQQQQQPSGNQVTHRGYVGSLSLTALSDERVAIVFFARTVRSVMASELRDGECLSNLVVHFIKSSLEAVASARRFDDGSSGSDARGGVPSEHVGKGGAGDDSTRAYVAALSRPPIPSAATTGHEERQADWLSTFDEPGAYAALLAESLGHCGGTPHDGARMRVLSECDAALAVAAAPEKVERVRAVPPLSAASSFLLTCYHLFLDELPDRMTTACLLLEGTRSTLEQCRRTIAHLERAERAYKKRQRAAEPSLWWRSKSEDGAKKEDRDSKASNQSGDGEKDTWQQTRILTEAFTLLTHSLQCFVCLSELEVKRASNLLGGALDRDIAELLCRLAHCIRQGQIAYDRTERALDGCADEINKPFMPLVTSRRENATREPSDAKEKTPHESGGEEAKRDFRNVIADALKELDELISNRMTPANREKDSDATEGNRSGPATADAKPSGYLSAARSPSDSAAALWYATGTSWLSRTAGAVPKLVIHSLLNAWEAVRRGGEVRETPEYLASNVFVFWWSLEEYAKLAQQALGGGDDAVNTTTAKGTTASMREWRGPGAAKVTDGKTHHSTPPVGAMGYKCGTQRQRKQFSTAHTRIRSQWLCAAGYAEALQSRQWQRDGMCAEIDSMLQATDAVDPAAVVQRVGALQRLRTPVALGDASQLDGANPFARCLLGHWHFLNLRSSADAAHSYSVVMKTKHSPLSPLHQSAAVGLGWVHLHRLSAATISSSLVGDSTVTNRLVWEKMAAELGLASTVGGHRHAGKQLLPEYIIDRLSMWVAPAGFVDFCGEARALLDLSSHLTPIDSLPAMKMAAAPSRSSTPGVGSVFHRGTASTDGSDGAVAMQRLSLGEAYFRKVLEVDPTNVGALCGMGRLCSLIPSGSMWNDGNCLAVEAHLLSPHKGSRAVRLPGVSATVKVKEASAYFRAAVQAARPPDSPCLAVPSASSMLEPAFASYAAYWLGNTCAPSTLTVQDEERIARCYYEQGAAVAGEDRRQTFIDKLGPVRLQQGAEALARAQEWYLRAVKLDPQNDWALTSLGLSFAQRARFGQGYRAHLPQPGSTSAAMANVHGRLAADAARGLAMLEMALSVNPRNQWALWGVANFGTSSQRRDECFRRLRSHLTHQYLAGRSV